MKRLIFTLLVLALMATPAVAVPTLQFSPDLSSSSAGYWHYDGSGTLSFVQDITVDLGLGSNADASVGTFVFIPAFSVTKISTDLYSVNGGTVTIQSKSDGSGLTYLTGTLSTGILETSGAGAGIYPSIKADLTGVVITNNGTLGSAALAAIDSAGLPLDFILTLQADSDFASILDGSTSNQNGFSGAMTIIPAPGAIILGSLGVGLVGWLRRRRTL